MEFPQAILCLLTLTAVMALPVPQRVIYSSGPTVFLHPPVPPHTLDPTAASLSPLGAVLRHTNALPGGKLDISEVLDIAEVLPPALGPAAAAAMLSPAFSTILNGVSNAIHDTVIQNDPYLFQRGRVVYQSPVSPWFNFYYHPPPI